MSNQSENLESSLTIPVNPRPRSRQTSLLAMTMYPKMEGIADQKSDVYIDEKGA